MHNNTTQIIGKTQIYTQNTTKQTNIQKMQTNTTYTTYYDIIYNNIHCVLSEKQHDIQQYVL